MPNLRLNDISNLAPLSSHIETVWQDHYDTHIVQINSKLPIKFIVLIGNENFVFHNPVHFLEFPSLSHGMSKSAPTKKDDKWTLPFLKVPLKFVVFKKSLPPQFSDASWNYSVVMTRELRYSIELNAASRMGKCLVKSVPCKDIKGLRRHIYLGGPRLYVTVEKSIFSRQILPYIYNSWMRIQSRGKGQKK